MVDRKALFLEFLTNSKEVIFSVVFMVHVRLKPTYFTRKSCKTKFEELVLFMLNLNTKSLQIEIDDFMK